MPEISINFNINRLPVSFGRHRPPGPVSKVPAEDKFLNCPLVPSRLAQDRIVGVAEYRVLLAQRDHQRRLSSSPPLL